MLLLNLFQSRNLYSKTPPFRLHPFYDITGAIIVRTLTILKNYSASRRVVVDQTEGEMDEAGLFALAAT